MEDQPTDSSDLTDTGGASKDTAASAVDKPAPTRGGVPVGKRSGRHRTFRPRPVAAGETVEAVEADSPGVEEADSPAVAESVEADSPGVEETVETEIPAELSPKAKRRRWFRGRSDKAADAAAGAEVVEEPPAPSEIAESADDAEEFPAEAPDDEEPDAEPVGPKPVGRRMVIAVAVAAALFVAAGAFGGAMLQPYLADRTVANTKLNIARTAASAITTLFTYTPDDMDQLSARSAKYLGGDLRDSYAKQVDALAATNKQNQIKRSAQVVGAAVESLNGPNATALVYANITYNSAATKDVPKIFLVSYRLTMQRKGSDWVVTNMPWITSKDLTRITP
ncbi:MAG: Mce-associated rane protein [Mycobacterium sp.]|nr:Mce-associated rane protein [Mycobacterium sp.]